MATQAGPKAQVEKQEGSIGDSFASLAGEDENILPARYLDLKRELIGDFDNQKDLITAWERLILRLAELADEIEERQQDIIPQVTYEDLVNAPSQEVLDRIKRCGSVVVRGVFSRGQALEWLDSIRAYIALNPQVKGFPEDDKQVFEIYWSKAQQEARSHPRMLQTQASLMSIFRAPAESQVSTVTPLVYADRLRIRHPGDARFALGPHMDGGSIERWEEPNYRKVFDKIFHGKWEDYDAWDMEKRALAQQDMYPGPGSTGVCRSWQGWTSLSETGPTEGTLLVYPYIREHTAYVLMRPLFKPRKPYSAFAEDRKGFLCAENWELDLESTRFPGSPPHRGQEMNDLSHPHLELQRTMIRMPKVQPGDSVWWHTDVIHAVESEHRGTNSAAVMYIPAVPLTVRNAEYLQHQRATFISGRPAPDFPGGIGESLFKSRGTVDDLLTPEGKEGMGLAPFRLDGSLSEGEMAVRKAANAILGF